MSWAARLESSYTSANQVMVSEALNTRLTTGGAGNRPIQSASSLPVANDPASDDVRSTPLSANGMSE